MTASGAPTIVSLGRPNDNPLQRSGDGTPALDDLARAAHDANGDVAASLALARDIGLELPTPGDGSTLALWETFATLAAADVTTARVIEPHIDALGILAEARAAGVDVRLGRSDAVGSGSAADSDTAADSGSASGSVSGFQSSLDAASDSGSDSAAVSASSETARDTSEWGVADATWGVFAAEGPGVRLEARPHADGWLLSGTKPWCSLADRLSHALVTAWLPSGERGLFAVALSHPGVSAHTDAWHAVGLADVASGPVDFSDVPAAAVGDAGWYLRRPGFAWGGIGVAACWFGGAVGVARALTAAAARREPDQIGLMHIGRVETALTAARLALRDAAEQIDGATGLAASDPGFLATRTRAIVADAAELVLGEVARALGPAPMALDARHARRVADLSLYVRQYHAERDEASLGRTVIERGMGW